MLSDRAFFNMVNGNGLVEWVNWDLQWVLSEILAEPLSGFF
jgi:hypothetical protein